MSSRQNWLEWIISLGSCAHTGLRQALKHRRAARRLQALEVLTSLEQGHRDFLRVVQELAKNDPDPAVQAAAQKLLNPHKQ